jgi:hypothetical protein
MDTHRVVRELQQLMDEIGLAILRTPTGERRNALCDANIHIAAAIQHIVDIS